MSDQARCLTLLENGKPCGNYPLRGSLFCRWHFRGIKQLPIETFEFQGPDPTEPALTISSDPLLCWPRAQYPAVFVWGLSFSFSAAQELHCTPSFQNQEGIAAVWDETEGGWTWYAGAGAMDQAKEGVGLAFWFDGPDPVLHWHPDIPLRADGLPDLRVFSTPRAQWGSLAAEAPPSPEKRGPGRPRRQPLPPVANDGLIRTEASRIGVAVISGLSRGLQRDIPVPAPDEAPSLRMGERWWAGIPVNSGSKRAGNLNGLIGLPREPDAALWDFLQRNGPLAVKAQIALWARVYQQTDGEPGRYVTQSISDFCDTLGYIRTGGAHKRENREKAIRVLKLLTELELMVFHSRNGRLTRLRGPIWNRGLLGEQLDTYSDLFGAARVGDPSEWVQVAFSYAPGQWFEDPEWRAQNRSFALVGENILQLRPDHDQAAILVGGYLTTQGRIANYGPKRFTYHTIAERTGLLEKDRRNPGRVFNHVERALDRLVEVSVLRDWQRTDITAEEPDMDNPEDLANLANPADNRKKKGIEITWPENVSHHARRGLSHDRRGVIISR